jgi:hypothetical protein
LDQEIQPAVEAERDIPPEVVTGTASPAETDPTSQTKSRVPREWVKGVASIKNDDPPADVPPHRWHQFVNDCNNFLASEWAARAAELGWHARVLFGCDCKRPLMYLGKAGLLWDINGGRLVHLYQDGAVIERSRNRHFHRRRAVDANITLPWSARLSRRFVR